MSLLTNFARGVKVELIAKLATSYEAYDGGTLIKGVAPHNIRDYFRKYGSTVRKFDHIEEGDIYIGYVRMSYRPEFLSAIILAGENAVAVSFDSEAGESNDFLTLMAKKEFADRMTAAVKRAAAWMKKAVPPTQAPTQPQVKIVASAPGGVAKKGNDSLGWMAILTVGGLLIAMLLIPILAESSFRASPTPAQEHAGYTVPTDEYESPSTMGPSLDPLSARPDQPLPNRAVEEDIPTVGQVLDTVTSGVNEFVIALKEGGMSGAAAKSIECHNEARASQKIIETDKCAAFDYAAKHFDDSAASTNGWPSTPYFVDRDTALHHAYSRFPSYSEMRLSIIRSEALAALQALPPSAFD